jgi:L-aminopeptidase/D-esterase-like protein
VDLGAGLVVGAIVAVNAFGDVVENGQIVAGARVAGVEPRQFADALAVLRDRAPAYAAGSFAPAQANTVIGVVATNARLNKEQANKVAQMAHDGLARTIRPAHTMLDGDTIFALSLGDKPADVNTIGAFAAEAMAQAILRGVRAAQPVPGWPAAGPRD